MYNAARAPKDNTFDARMDSGIQRRNLQSGVAPKPMRSGSEMQGNSITSSGGPLQSDGHLRTNAAGAQSSRAIAPAAVSGAYRGPVTASASEIASMAAANDATRMAMAESEIASMMARARDASGKYTMPNDVIADNGVIRPIEWRQVTESPPHYTPFFWDGDQLWDVIWAKGAWRKLNPFHDSQRVGYTVDGKPKRVRLTNCTYDPIAD